MVKTATIKNKDSHRAILRAVFLILIVGLISISIVSAWEIDNVQNKDITSYGRAGYKDIEIKNSFGFGKTLWSGTLDTNTEVCSDNCKATQTITLHEPGVLIEDVIYERIYEDGSTELVGIRDEKIYANGDLYIPGTIVPAGTYDVELTGSKRYSWQIDWIYITQGETLDTWANWGAGDLTNNLVTYWSFDEGAGLNANDNVTGTYNQTLVPPMSTNNWTSGLINNAIIYNGTGAYSTFSNNSLANTQNWSINFWMKPDTVAAASTMTLALGIEVQGVNIFTNGDFQINIGGSNVVFTSEYNTSWNMVTLVYDESNTNFTVYLNTNATDSGTYADSNHNSTDGNRWGINFDGLFDEAGIWNKTLSQSDINELYNSGAGFAYPFQDTFVTLNSPIDGYSQLPGNVNFSANLTITGATGVNMSLWHNKSGTFELIKTNNVTGTTNITQFNDTFVAGNYIWNVQTCDSDGDCGFANNNRTLKIVQIIENSQTYNAMTTEGATETFLINMTKSPVIQVSTVSLVYDGVSYSFPYSVTGNEVIAESSIAIPSQTTPTTVDFFWSILLSDGSIVNTTSNSQIINIIEVDNCTSFTKLIYNFTQYDEEDKTILDQNTTMEITMNLYDTKKTLSLVNFSQTFSAENPATICLNNSLLTTVNYSSYVVAKYFANLTGATNKSYSVEYYNILNQTLGNSTVPINVSLYDLKEEDTTKFRLTFRNAAYILAPDILVNVYRQYIEDNDFKVVEIPLTDSNGQTMLNLVRNDIIYNFIMTNEAGKVIATFNSVTAFCQDFTIGECTINLAPDSATEEAYDYNEEFEISITEPSYSNVTERITISFRTDDLQPKTVKMEAVRNNDFGNRTVCTDTLTAASGTLSCDASSITDSDQYIFTSVIVDDELANQDSINLNASTLNFGVINGGFYGFLMLLLLITIFMEDKKVLIASLGLGWLAVISLGLINGKLLGFTSAGIWILVSIAIFLWKLNKEETI